MSGHLVGPIWDAQRIAQFAYAAGWTNAEDLVTAVAVCLAECDGFINSYNDNTDETGKIILSRDVGMWEINIPASEIGTAQEKLLYDPKTNAEAAYDLWKKRGWEPWVSYTTGIVFDDRYVITALIGVLNFLATFAVQAQEKLPARAANHELKSPLISLPQLRILYPNTPV